MRECIYCGRQLEKGEVCTCAMSVAKRRERAEKEAAEREARPKTKAEERADAKEKKRREAEKSRTERAEIRERRRRERKATRGGSGNPFPDVWRLFKSFLRSPVETVLNPGEMSRAVIMIFAALEGMIGGLCVYSIVTGASRGPLRLLGNLLGFKGAAGYGVILGWLASAASGAISGILLFFLYSGVFWLVGKWVFRQFTPYRTFSGRFVFTALPTALIGAAGVILGIFSQTTFVVLLFCGIAGTVALTYEILRSVWYSKSPAKTLYTMLFCIFIFLMITLYIVRISMI